MTFIRYISRFVTVEEKGTCKSRPDAYQNLHASNLGAIQMFLDPKGLASPPYIMLFKT